MKREGRNLERVWILAIAIVMGFLFYQLFGVLQRDFVEVPTRLQQGSMVNLNFDQPGNRMKQLLTSGFYLDDPRDIELIGNTIKERIGQDDDVIDNIGEL